MEPATLCLVTAAARAAATLKGAALLPGELEPPHPAFVGFKRMSYIWSEAGTISPLGEQVTSWLEFVRASGATDAVLDLSREEVIVTLSAQGASCWQVGDVGGMQAMRGMPCVATMPSSLSPADAEEQLRAAIASVSGGADYAAALNILAAPDDGQEVTDVAWPYFVLPERAYATSERRLFTAACAVWPSLPPFAEGPSADAVVAAARRAAAAAVNAPGLVARPSSPVSR